MPMPRRTHQTFQACLTPAETSAPSARRTALLEAITDTVYRNGLVNLSLREIARQIGVSAPALLHHFGDKETLLREALHSLHQRELVQLDRAFDGVGVSEALARLWEAQSTPGERRCQAAANEIQSVVQNDPARFPSYHQHLSRPWIAAMNGALERSKAPEPLRIAMATLLVGTYRGLLNDLLATGESRRLNAAFQLLLDNTRSLEMQWHCASETPPATDDVSNNVGGRP